MSCYGRPQFRPDKRQKMFRTKKCHVLSNSIRNIVQRLARPNVLTVDTRGLRRTSAKWRSVVGMNLSRGCHFVTRVHFGHGMDSEKAFGLNHCQKNAHLNQNQEWIVVSVELLQINANHWVVVLMIKSEMFHGAFTKMKFYQKKNQLPKLSIGQKTSSAQRCQKLERQELTMSALMDFGKLKIRSFFPQEDREVARTPGGKLSDT